jgi:nucleotide-binding universal stress UspA family protein
VTSTEAASTGRIVAGVDGSNSSIAAMHWAARQSKLTGSSLQVIMTWEWPTTYGWAIPFADNYDPATEAQRYLDEIVEKLRGEHPDLAVQARVFEGHPALILVDASAAADLLVVGSRGHGEFVGMLLGSISEHCAAHAHCPVVVFRDRQ